MTWWAMLVDFVLRVILRRRPPEPLPEPPPEPADKRVDDKIDEQVEKKYRAPKRGSETE